jgi:hypothetical protein
MTASHIVATCLGIAIVLTIGVFVWQFANLSTDALPDEDLNALNGSAPKRLTD